MKWEYDDGYDLDVAELDEYGADGWELVAVLPGEDGGDRFVFKRPAADNSVVVIDGSKGPPSQYG